MSKIKQCPECGASVSRTNVERHMRKVHGRGPAEIERSRDEKASAVRQVASLKRRGARRRRAAMVIGAIGLAGLLLGGLVMVASSFDWSVDQPPPGVDSCVEHTGVGIHWHAVLTITISGSPQKIPANIGVLPGCMAPLHTHAEDGVIHIEYSRPVGIELRQFFDLWGQPFDEDSILWHEGAVKMRVDGRSSSLYGKLPLSNGMRIDIIA